MRIDDEKITNSNVGHVDVDLAKGIGIYEMKFVVFVYYYLII